jgi:hypothetical protein
MQEFPKCLYQGGDVAAEYTIVVDAGQEADARNAGFAMAGEGGADLMAEAEALGIKVDKRWGADRLAAEIQKAKGE